MSGRLANHDCIAKVEENFRVVLLPPGYKKLNWPHLFVCFLYSVYVFCFGTKISFHVFFNFAVDPCENIFCLNGGTCILTPESYNDTSDPCICRERFIGRYCDTYLAGKDINYRAF